MVIKSFGKDISLRVEGPDTIEHGRESLALFSDETEIRIEERKGVEESFGGCCEVGDTLIASVSREVFEETNSDLV